MNNINIGMLAHVDAGKTTLSESLLYVSGSIRQLGRVDHGNAFLDYDAQEKDRGITIYAKQAIFDWKDTRITLLDTPGHVDFSAEMERVLQVLDYAVVIINALDGIQSHTETIWKLLQHYHVPALVFVNKMDVSHTERTQIMEDLKRHLDEHCVDVTLQDEACQEQLAMCSDELLESYMETGGITDEQLADAVAQRTIFPCCFGSALKMEGIQEFLDMLNSCTKAPAYPEAFGARIFKISRDENGNRLTHMKITGGSLKVKTKLAEDEKVDQIRLYSGTRYQLCEEACSGCVCAVKGLTDFHAGDGLGFERSRQEVQLTSFMNYRVQLPTGCDPFVMLKQLRQLAEEGYHDITLLGQNVNSYGKDLEEPMDFADLLEQVNAIPGDFLVRFMTSHPKDATHKLFETMARCEKVAPVLHLPFQAGNDRVLKVMNRRHTRAQYLEKIRDLKSLIPDIVLTSDIIVGFPGETTEEFEDTLRVLEEVRFDALFTFIYSPRVGTPAAKMDDPMPREEKLANFNRLVALQDAISEEKHAAYIGKTVRCLLDGVSDDPRYDLTARTPGNRLVRVTGDREALGQFRDVKITGANKWSLFGELA